MSDRYYSRRVVGLSIIGLLSISTFLVANNFSSVSAQGSWWNSSWPYRKMITVDHAQVFADFANFPVLIDIVDPDLVAKANSDGGDIVFTDYSGVKLNHEMESYDNRTGHVICWVSANLSSGTDTLLYMYYGNSGASDQENRVAVWDSGYGMVQHLEESAAASPTDWYKFAGNPTLNGSQNGFASVFYC